MSDLISRQAAIDALDEIRHALWEIDIPSPTVPEYVEHHEQVQSVWKLLDKKQKELYGLPSAQPERKTGKWINEGRIIRCNKCKIGYATVKGMKSALTYNFCPNCGTDMRGEQDE